MYNHIVFPRYSPFRGEPGQKLSKEEIDRRTLEMVGTFFSICLSTIFLCRTHDLPRCVRLLVSSLRVELIPMLIIVVMQMLTMSFLMANMLYMVMLNIRACLGLCLYARVIRWPVCLGCVRLRERLWCCL